MAYQTVKEGIAKLLLQQGFAEAGDVFSFDQESDQNINRKYRIERPGIDFDNSLYINTLVRPESKYKISLAFKVANEKPRFDYDVANNLIDAITAYFANPVNYTAFCTLLRFNTIETEPLDGFLLSTISLTVIDDITLT